MSRAVRRSLGVAWVPAVTLAAGACFATRNDVRLLQGDVATLRAEAARADSMHRAQMQQVARQVGAVADSLHSANAFLLRFSTDVSRFQGDLTLALHSFGQQLIAVQELTGQSQKKLQDLRTDLETKQAELAAAALAPGTPAGPGPNQLYQIARQQLMRGAVGAARSAFQDLLAQYPASELAPDALFGIAESLQYEGNLAAADSAFQLVVDQHPKSDRAPVALYKRAMIQVGAGQSAKARALFQQIVEKYPTAPEADLARDKLKAPE